MSSRAITKTIFGKSAIRLIANASVGSKYAATQAVHFKPTPNTFFDARRYQSTESSRNISTSAVKKAAAVLPTEHSGPHSGAVANEFFEPKPEKVFKNIKSTGTGWKHPE